jgi:hypothetical protein
VLAERRTEVEGVSEKFVYPIIHALLPRKDVSIYLKLWRMIKEVS